MTGSGSVNWLRQRVKWVCGHAVNSSPQSNLQSFKEIRGCNDEAFKFFLSAFTAVMSLTILITCHFLHFICWQSPCSEKEVFSLLRRLHVWLQKKKSGAGGVAGVKQIFAQAPDMNAVAFWPEVPVYLLHSQPATINISLFCHWCYIRLKCFGTNCPISAELFA